MERELYLECYSGISGDMTVAALLDLGADEKVLMDVLNSLPLTGYHVEINRVIKSGIDACDFDVVLENQDNHDHDMEYLYGHLHGEHGIEEHNHNYREHLHHHAGHENEDMHEHQHEHEHHDEHGYQDENHDKYEHQHEHEHHDEHGYQDENHDKYEHQHEHEHHDEHGYQDENHDKYEHQHEHEHHDGHERGRGHHHHEHRGMKEITEIINKGDMTEGARKLALHIFDILAHAESKAHNVPVEEVHFHEVGAVDSIVDIVSIAVCLDNLNIKECVVTHLTEGKGTVRCQHGILPVPVPAVLHIVTDHHIPLEITDITGELVTPTGAAVVAAIGTTHELPKKFNVEKIGVGAGKRQYECPGILRAMLINT